MQTTGGMVLVKWTMVPANKIGEGWGATEGAIAYSIYRIYFSLSTVIHLGTVVPGHPESVILGSEGLC